MMSVLPLLQSRIALAVLIMSAFIGCSSTDTASNSPLESKLLALENRSVQLHGDSVAAQRAAQDARLASISYALPEPDLHAAPDVMAPATATNTKAARSGSPIGRVSN